MLTGIIDSNQKIVTNGLALHLDAAQLRSYPGSGTTWTDLSGNRYNGSLINGPTFNSGNGGSIVFDGINDYVPINNGLACPLISTNNLTCQIWLYPQNDSGFVIRNRTFGYYIYQNLTTINVGLFATNNASSQVQLSTSIVYNTPVNIAFTFESSTLSLYKNGTFISNISAIANTIYCPEQRVSLGRDADSAGEYLVTRVYNCIIYNRGLSNTEVLQNYNATKSRFGL